MDYPYEQLTPEKFQEFCQSLISSSFPSLQCFPVGQPDGGRDAWAYQASLFPDPYIIFQVKFVRQPSLIDDPAKWLAKQMDTEIQKIDRYLDQGVQKFILITNLRGTAHPDSGSIDRVSTYLREHTKIESMCWWRADLNRRLDNAWNLKWAYPELMTGPDLIRSIIEGGLGEARERRSAAIRAFITHQYNTETEVRFKQIELQNRLLDLFIDVPISYSPVIPKRHVNRHYYLLRWIAETTKTLPEDIDEHYYDSRRGEIPYRDDLPLLGAATLFLHRLAQVNFPRVVIEGAPGQGKSTITQYICQVHRMKLLSKSEAASIPKSHFEAPPRLPFKIDCRDLAAWLSGQNPFASEDEVNPPAVRSLETFLAAQVEFGSGGTSFSVDDLISVARLSAILLVLDGLDEVAEMQLRQDVVVAIAKGVERLEANAASLQVIVTSRPAAFANSPGMPEPLFPYFELAPVTPRLISEYAEKWLKARRLHGREASDVRKILKQKLQQPHIRDLARNPMQLAILLSLIHTRGVSLPDKRTSLYDSYVELFFDREAEKSLLVRDHRVLLINIHRYLGWILHTEAELGSSSGSITEQKIHGLLRSYLENEGYDPNLAGILFTGMVERVVALVSRVQGTYEFEVQPLREYFAARFLYETAPYSPTGDEKRGTKPDRFDAIARDFYWLNVARFYAGCYSKGELASLIDSLQDLVSEPGYSEIGHPRLLASTLLGDWVFSQHPKSVKAVVAIAADCVGLRCLLGSAVRRSRPGGSSVLVLPKECGRDELLGHCFKLLVSGVPREFSDEIIDVMRANAMPEDLAGPWLLELQKVQGAKLTEWIEHGLRMGTLPAMGVLDADRILSERCDTSRRIELLLRGGYQKYIENNHELFNSCLDLVMNGQVHVPKRRKLAGTLDLIGSCLNPRAYAISFGVRGNAPLTLVWRDSRGSTGESYAENLSIDDHLIFEEAARCYQFAAEINNWAGKPIEQWRSSIEPWERVIEFGRELFGDRWTLCCLANVASAIRNQKETCSDANSLLDHSLSLTRRFRYARLRTGNAQWWGQQIDRITNQNECMLALLPLLTWGSPRVLGMLAKVVDQLLEMLDVDMWQRLARAVQEEVRFLTLSSRRNSVNVSEFPKVGYRLAAILNARSRTDSKSHLYKQYFSGYRGVDEVVISASQATALSWLGEPSADWYDVAETLSWSFLNGHRSGMYSTEYFTRRRGESAMPEDLALKITSSPDKYPGFLVTAAEARCRQLVAKRIVPVGKIAERDSWFEQDAS